MKRLGQDEEGSRKRPRREQGQEQQRRVRQRAEERVRQRADVTFERNIDYLNNVPHIITTRPLFTGDLERYDENTVMNAVAREITRSAENALVTSLGWTVQQVRERARGYVTATNMQTADVRSFDIDATNFNPTFLQDCIVQMQKSNESVSIFDLEWRFIFYESSLHVGGSRTPVIPKWWSARHTNTWKAWSYRDVEIGCAAYALNWIKNKSKHYNVADQAHLKDAAALQRELGWKTYMSVSHMQEFVIKYPKYKLVIIVPHMLHCIEKFIGTEYVDQILYLYFDPAQQHFSSGPTPLTVVRAARNDHYNWCIHCDVAFTHTVGHECDQRVVEAKKYTKPAKCPKCFVYGKHECELVTCKACRSNYQGGREGFNHRCILYQEERRETRQMFLGMPDAPPKSPALYVYDIEARMQLVETKLPYLQHTETADDMYPTELVHVYEKVVQQHVANMIVYKQVFSDEPAVVLTGDDCLQLFLTRMMFLNNGNNVCIAHNAAGYDTRLIFSEAVRMNCKTSIFPILRGGMFLLVNVSEIHESQDWQRLVFPRLAAARQRLAQVTRKRFL